MQPIPEVRAAAAELQALVEGDGDLLAGLEAMGRLAVALVPSCLGLSLTLVVDGEPYTMTATAPGLEVVDAAQYLDGGPCVDAALHDAVVAVDDVLDEQRWQLFRSAAVGQAVRASLSLPVAGSGGRLPGALNLYAGDPEAFSDRLELLASVYRVPLEELVTDADLPFRTLEAARRLPERLQAKGAVDRAVGALADARGLSAADARSQLTAAAVRAGSSLEDLAATVLRSLSEG